MQAPFLEVNIVNTGRHELPEYATSMSAGVDLRANIEGSLEILPLERKLIPTGLFIELPPGYEAQIRPRSGLAFKSGITVLNSPGTIDADYRGELKVLLVNISDKAFTLHDGERVAQMVVARHEQVKWVKVPDLNRSERGQGGFGSTGKK